MAVITRLIHPVMRPLMWKKTVKKQNMIMEGATCMVVESLSDRVTEISWEVFQAGSQWNGPERQYTWALAGSVAWGGNERKIRGEACGRAVAAL